MTLQIYTDGGSLNNPGQAAYSYILLHNLQQIALGFEKIGVATNNIAEYTGLIKALEKVKELKASGKFLINNIEVF